MANKVVLPVMEICRACRMFLVSGDRCRCQYGMPLMVSFARYALTGVPARCPKCMEHEVLKEVQHADDRRPL